MKLHVYLVTLDKMVLLDEGETEIKKFKKLHI